MATASGSPQEERESTLRLPEETNRRDSGYDDEPTNTTNQSEGSSTATTQLVVVSSDTTFCDGRVPRAGFGLPSQLTRTGEEIESMISGMENSSINEPVAEKSVEDLKTSHRERLQTLLDMTLFSYPNWYLLGLEIFKGDEQGNKEKLKRLQDLHACYCGGGNRALHFLDILKSHQSTLTCSDFAGTAKKLCRMDIYHVFSGNNTMLAKLDDDKKLDLATMLNENYHGWEFFAEEYKLSKDDIRLIKQTVKTDGVYSPTERLLEWLDSAGVTLKKLKETCTALKFMNVVKVIEGIEDELSKENTKCQFESEEESGNQDDNN